MTLGSRPLRAGAVVCGRYRLVAPLGSGGMATVWRARDRRTGAVVAVKVLTDAHQAALQRLVQEQSLRLEHPHLLPVIGWSADDAEAVLVTPVARGGSVDGLAHRLGPLPTGLVAVLLDQLLAALEVVHGAGIVHRDVKPDNLLLHATGRGYPRLLLADFGVAVLPDRPRLTCGPGVVGTAGYMPPDQAAGAAPDPWWDVHAAGVVARELLTGRRDGEVGGALAPVVAALMTPGATATVGRRLLADVGVPTAVVWPALGMPVLGDVCGRDGGQPAWWRLRARPSLLALALGLSLSLSLAALVVSVTGR